MLPGVKKDGPAGGMPEEEWHQIACGEEHTAAVTPTGELYTWGPHGFGRLGQGNDDDDQTEEPKLVTSLSGKKAVNVSCGQSHTAVVTSEGELYTWYVYKVPY